MHKSLVSRMKPLGIVSLIALLLPTTSFAAANLNVEYVQKSVVFLYAADASGNPGEPVGTGFIVQVPLMSDPGKAYKLLVTARHMVDPKWAGCANQGERKLFLRVNKKNFDPAKERIGTVDLVLSEVMYGKWFLDPDDEVDAAVAVLDAKEIGQYDVEGVKMTDFPSAEEIKTFGAGDDVVSAGLLPGASGKKRNYPIFKFGHISSIPEESADAPKCGQVPPSHSLKVWFIAASLVPGNSGSPIYFAPPILGGRRPVLLGVQSMSFLAWDVAGMTPVQYVYGIIEQMKLKDADLARNVQPKKP